MIAPPDTPPPGTDDRARLTRTKKLGAGIAVAALVAGGGAALAASKLGSSSSKASLGGSNVATFGAAGGAGSGAFGGGSAEGGNLGGGALGNGGLSGEGPGNRFDGDGDGGRRGFDRGFGRGFGGGPFGGLDAAASYLGLPATTLQSDLQSGKSLAQLATAAGKPVGGLVAAMVAAEKKQLDALVSAGRLTKAQEQAFTAQATARVTAMVNGARPGGGFRGPGLDGGGGSDDGPGSDDGAGGGTGTGSATF